MGMFRFLCSLLIALLVAPNARAEDETPIGVWLHENGRIQVEITPCGALLCGRLVWFRWPNDAQGLPLVDVNNPDPALRTQPLLGLQILGGLHRTGDDLFWEDGVIYNPDDGTYYNVTMTIEDDGTLHVRAYVLVPLLGTTLIWTRLR